MKEHLITLGESALKEDSQVEFKRSFEPHKKSAFWAEIVKDIIAMANTMGGVLIFGLEDDGSPSPEDCSSLLSFDPAQITDQIAKYTGMQFSRFETVQIVRPTGIFPALLVYATRLPIVFTKVGTYEFAPGKQKTAFSEGTLYFRHGAKSQPATQDDIRDAFYRELEFVRDEWLGNVRKVTEVAVGAKVLVTEQSNTATHVRVTDDPNAPAVRVKELSETHPYRQAEALREIRKRHAKKIKINSHDIQAIKHAEKMDPETHPDLIHRPHWQASPQYSAGFVEFVVQQLAANDNYLLDCRKTYKQAMYGD